MQAYRTSAKLKLGLIAAAVTIAVVSLVWTNRLADRLMQQDAEGARTRFRGDSGGVGLFVDAVERPERPIPSGLIKKRNAALFGALLLLSGMLAAGLVQAVFFSISFYIAVGIAAASVLYDGWGKHHGWLGPLNMGLCRGLNLALGISVVAPILSAVWYVCFVPVVYIAAVTAISRGEVHGGQKRVLYFAALLYGAVLFCIAGIAYKNNHLLPALPFILLFSIQILQPLFQAIHDPVGPKIGKAVKAGVLALILMNAAWAAAFGFWYVGLGMLLLLPLSMRLARWFAVT